MKTPREVAKEYYKRLKEMTTTGSIGTGPETRLGDVPSTRAQGRKKPCSNCNKSDCDCKDGRT